MPVSATTAQHKAQVKQKRALSGLLTTKHVSESQSNADPLRFIAHYSPSVIAQVNQLIKSNKLAENLKQRYPDHHDIRTDKSLYQYAMAFKQQYLKQSSPLSKVIFDDKISLSHQALGLHSYVQRRQGNKVKAKNEIRISSRLKSVPEPLLKMVVVHELAHLKEKDHNKAFYQLCCAMTQDYHQLEFDLRLLLVCEALADSPYETS
ncbi:M48 family metallopeptidase [Shewanella maritima]|uniref:M48 metallopeptidase family protein n=1 Tax=Shewanella maritima TaxID=2520507 RepID=UPI003736AC9D